VDTGRLEAYLGINEAKTAYWRHILGCACWRRNLFVKFVRLLLWLRVVNVICSIFCIELLTNTQCVGLGVEALGAHALET
jgi:hypothetical protein